MKTKLTIILTIISYGFLSQGNCQEIKLAVNAGIAYTSFPQSNDSKHYLSAVSGGIRPQASFKGSLDLQRWDIGIGIGYAKMAYSYENPMYLGPNKEDSLNYNVEVPMYPVYVFANYKVNFSGSSIYFGLNAGHIFYSGQEDNSTSPAGKVSDIPISDPGTIVAGGIQLGYALNINEKLKLNAELGVTYVPVKVTFDYYSSYYGTSSHTMNSHYFMIPLSIGVQYSL